MSTLYLDATEKFIPSRVTIGNLKSSAKGGKVSSVIDVTTRKSLKIKLPQFFTFGAQQKINNEGEFTNDWNMSLVISKQNEKQEAAHQFLDDLFEHIKTLVHRDYVAWFGHKQVSKEVSDNMFNLLLRFPNKKGTKEPDETKDPMLSVNLTRDFKNPKLWNFVIYDNDSNPLYDPHLETPVVDRDPVLEIMNKKMCQVETMVEMAGIWVQGKNIYITTKMVEIIPEFNDTAVHVGGSLLRPNKKASASSSSSSTTEVNDSDDEPDANDTGKRKRRDDDEHDVIEAKQIKLEQVNDSDAEEEADGDAAAENEDENEGGEENNDTAAADEDDAVDEPAPAPAPTPAPAPVAAPLPPLDVPKSPVSVSGSTSGATTGIKKKVIRKTKE